MILLPQNGISTLSGQKRKKNKFLPQRISQPIEAKCRTQAALDALMIFPEERRARLVELANYLLNREY